MTVRDENEALRGELANQYKTPEIALLHAIFERLGNIIEELNGVAAFRRSVEEFDARRAREAEEASAAE